MLLPVRGLPAAGGPAAPVLQQGRGGSDRATPAGGPRLTPPSLVRFLEMEYAPAGLLIQRAYKLRTMNRNFVFGKCRATSCTASRRDDCVRQAIPYLLEAEAAKIIVMGSGSRLRPTP